MEETRQMRTTALTTSIGAQVHGVDLKQPLAQDLADGIRQALAEHAVLVFREQHLNNAQQETVARLFGPLEPAPSRKLFGLNDPVRVIERPVFMGYDQGVIPYAPRREDYQGFHVDDGFCAQIPNVATLRPVALAPAGGDTLWSSMASVFESFSPAMKAWLETLNGVNAAPPNFRATVGFYDLPKDAQRRFDDEEAVRVHPVVVKHPITGRKSLFVSPTYTAAIEDLSHRESTMLLRFLFGESVRADFVYRHHWEMGDLVIWDELATLHAGPEKFAPERQLVRVYGGLTTPTAARPRTASPSVAIPA